MKRTLFPLPRNRRTKPTDENVLLHALAVAIRDGSSHKRIRKLIEHLPKIMHRKSPFDATQQENFELTDRIGELERLLRDANRKLARRKPCAPVGANGQD